MPGVPTEPDTPHNARVLEHVTDLSAHSDIGDVLLEAVQPLGDVQLFCPDAATYRFVLASTNSAIFGFAVGSSAVSRERGSADPSAHR